jgi:hypothetical protein
LTHTHAFRLAEYLETEPARKKAAADAAKAKLETLEKRLGIVPASVNPTQPSASGSSSSSANPGDSAQLAGKKHRFDDTEYLEQSRDIVDSVKSAVSAGMLRRKKKAKTVIATTSASTTTAIPATALPEPQLDDSKAALVPPLPVATAISGVS